jgi:ribosomal protein L9
MQKSTMTIQKVESQIDQHSVTLAMQGQLRQAIFDAITEQDVADIVKKQVDYKSLQFVMKYVLGFGQPVTLQQINVLDVETAARVAKQGGSIRSA